MDKQKKYTMQDFEKIIETLRSENGCPWDREQTHESLRPCMMEEAAELLAAIRIYEKTGSAENMKEELGDILLQVFMHSQIAKEEKLFTLEDVVQEISEKMIRRHPHVFGDVHADTSQKVLENWEEIKKQEKEGKTWIESPLKEIPRELPALTRAVKLIKKADKIYGEGKNFQEAIDDMNVQAMLLKEKSTMNREEYEQIIGDILLNVSYISHYKSLQQEQLLQDLLEEMIEKYEKS